MKIELTKAYDEVKVFENFTMDISDKKINIIMGPSGCGKTTLLRSIAGLSDFRGEISPRYRNIGYVFQEDRLFPYLTVIDNLLLINRDKERVKTLMQDFNVSDKEDKYPRKLSGGERQRIAIMRIFLRDYDLILMDEPFKSLDFHLKSAVIEKVYQLHQKLRATMIIVTHDVNLAMYMGHVIHVLSDKVSNLKQTIINPYTHQNLNPENVAFYQNLTDLLIT